MTGFRIGNGIDVHRLVPGRRLFLCGIEIPCELGLEGHSDADVALHSLMDALLGALALDDIGEHFPDRDPAYLGADSKELLRRVWNFHEFRDWSISNLDLTIVAQKPKLAPYREEMRRSIAGVLGLDLPQISVKATTTERLGFTGRGEGIASFCTVLLTGKRG